MKNIPARKWAETSDVKKAIDILYSRHKLAVLNYTRLILKMVIILALAVLRDHLT